MAVDERHRGHGVGDQTAPEREETAVHEGGVFHGILVVEAVGVEFRDRRGRDYHAFGEFVLDYVQGEEEGGVEGRCESVVGGCVEGEHVDFGGGLGADEAALVALRLLAWWDGRDLEHEEGWDGRHDC